MADIEFKGRVAIVTGAGGGLGRQHALALAARGAKVLVNDLGGAVDGSGGTAGAAQKVVDEIRAAGGEALANAASVTDFAAVEAMVQQAIDAWGRVDVLVNSAGITGPNVKVWDYPVDAWKQVFDVNVHGLFHCCRELSAHMKARNYGRIVNIASVAGKDGNPNASAYSASKAAVIGLTKSLGKELADTGVRVNCVTPAAVKTAIFDQMTPEHIQFMLSKIPMARFGEPEEVAAMVTWLSTEECSFSTGAVFDLSGGRSTY
jgi:3-oxoacyl-[acyl-carrier protein] reductase